MKPKRFGFNSFYTLDFLTGWLEDVASDEEEIQDEATKPSKKREKNLERLHAAIGLLNEILE